MRLLRMAETMLGLRASGLENPSTSLANPAKWLLDLAGGGKSAAGVHVTEEKAMGVATMYACVGLISRSLMTLPIHVYRRAGKFSEPAPDHWSQKLLSESPNMLHTSVVWMQLIATHASFWGAHYAAMDMAPDGSIELIPLIPKNTRAVLLSTGRRKKYVTQLADGTEKEFREDEVLHFPVPAINGNGVTGVRPVQTLKNLFGHRIAAEDFNSRFFANDARPGVILETPASMDEVAQKNLVESLYAKYTGAENRWKVLVLEEGAKMHTVQMPLKDAQFLESIQVDDVQICGVNGVPPHMVGITEKSTAWGTGLVEMFLGFSKLTMLPWCRVIEAELKRKWYSGTDYFAKFNLEGMQRGDYKSRMEGHQIAVNNGLKMIDEVRELEDDQPLPDGLGRIPLVPSNLQTLKNARDAKPDALVKPATAAETARVLQRRL